MAESSMSRVWSLVKFGYPVFEVSSRTDRHTDMHMHTYRNISHLYRGQGNKAQTSGFVNRSKPMLQLISVTESRSRSIKEESGRSIYRRVIDCRPAITLCHGIIWARISDFRNYHYFCRQFSAVALSFVRLSPFSCHAPVSHDRSHKFTVFWFPFCYPHAGGNRAVSRMISGIGEFECGVCVCLSACLSRLFVPLV